MSAVDPRHCRTGDPDNGGNCTACEEYRRLRAEDRKRRGLS